MILAVFIPLIYFTPNKITYDNTNEISDSYHSVKAINIIKDKFELGEAFPVTIAIKDDHKLTTSKGLGDLESLSKSINKIDGVKGVNTVTRPTGTPIKQLSATNQLDTIQKKLNKANNGLGQVNSGLGDMQSKVEPYTNSEKVQQQKCNKALKIHKLHHKVSRNKLVNYLKAYNKPNKVTKSNERSKEIQSYLDGMANDKSVNQSGMYISDDMMKTKI